MSKTYRNEDNRKNKFKKRNRLSLFKQKYYETLKINEWYIELPVTRQ